MTTSGFSFTATCIVVLSLVGLLQACSGAEPYSVQRLNGGEPILSSDHFAAVGAPGWEGANINGPSVIRIPDWIPPGERASPEARYYLYFAHHRGKYIRMAWAVDVEGPWQLYGSGAGVPVGGRGVLDLGTDNRIELPGPYSIYDQLASPDVHVDDDDRRIVMYFHGHALWEEEKIRAQKTFVASSARGLDFSTEIVPAPLGGSYMRVFEYNGNLHSLGPQYHRGPVEQAEPWAIPGNFALENHALWPPRLARFLCVAGIAENGAACRRSPHPRIRHIALHREGERLHVFFTMKAQAPERIVATSVHLGSPDWMDAAATGYDEVMRPERDWEGADLPAVESGRGAADVRMHALRDPFVFSDGGALYLFYAGGGEQAIGLARLTINDEPG